MWQCGKVASRGFRSRDEQPIQDDWVWVGVWVSGTVVSCPKAVPYS
jgi:hypothetical protein